jgi:succinoglycan biosynthesis transport protein ExoP
VNPGVYVGTHRRLIIAIAAAVGTAAFMLGGTLPPGYESTARVTLEAVGTQRDSESVETDEIELQTEEIDFATQASVARSLDVERIAAERLGLKGDFAGLAGPLSVVHIEDTDILSFTYGSRDPETAEMRANAFAEAYLEFRRRVVAGEAIVQGAELQEKLNAVESDLQDVLARSRRTPDPASQASLASFAGILEGVATRIEFELAELADIPPVGMIVQRAEGSVQSSPNTLLNAGLGLMLGIAVGIVYAARRFRRDERALSVEQLEIDFGAPVLGHIPHLGGWIRRSPLVGASGAPSRAAEAYRILRTNVLSPTEADRNLSIIVTSARPGEGKSITAANLALVTARSGKSVVLLSGDLRNHGLSELFGRSGFPGLTDVLTGGSPLDRALVHVRRNVDLLPAGSPTDDPADLLGSPTMKDLLDTVKGRADLVIIDAPAMLGIADSVALPPLTDGLLFVVDARTSSPEDVRLARSQLDKMNVHILGSVFNGRFVTGGRKRAFPRLRRVVLRGEAV